MSNPQIEDHVVGIELQLVELVEREHRAEVQGLDDQVAELKPEIESLQAELASIAEKLGPADEDEIDPEDHPVLLAEPAGKLYKTA